MVVTPQVPQLESKLMVLALLFFAALLTFLYLGPLYLLVYNKRLINSQLMALQRNILQPIKKVSSEEEFL
jgi:hypothetical protein